MSPLQQNVFRAGSAWEARRLLLKQDFALILLDVRMAEMDGFETSELNRIVDDLLLASRMDVNSLPDRGSQFDLQLAVRGALARAEPRVQLLDATLNIDGDETPILVQADPDHVGRILDNLINNAL